VSSPGAKRGVVPQDTQNGRVCVDEPERLGKALAGGRGHGPQAHAGCLRQMGRSRGGRLGPGPGRISRGLRTFSLDDLKTARLDRSWGSGGARGFEWVGVAQVREGLKVLSRVFGLRDRWGSARQSRGDAKRVFWSRSAALRQGVMHERS